MSREFGYNPYEPEQNAQEIPKVDKTIAFVDASADTEQRARDLAEAELLKEKEDIDKGATWKNSVPRLWKKFAFTKKYEYARQKKIAAAKKRMEETGNWYLEEGEEDDTAKELAAVVERFVAEADGEARHGEQKQTLEEYLGEDKAEKAQEVKGAIKELMSQYATGELADKEAFIEARNRALNSIEDLPDAVKNQVLGHADNMFDVAESARSAFNHHKSLENLDLDFDIIIAKAKTGVRTKAELNGVDKLVDKLKGTRIGQYVDETTLAAAVAIGYTATAVAFQSVARSRVVAWGTAGAGAIIGGVFAGARENKRVKEERAQHARERAQGKEIKTGSSRREEMEKYIHKSIPAKEVANSLNGLIKEDGVYSEDELKVLIDCVAEVDARIQKSDRDNIDLLRYSDAKLVEQERLDLDKARSKIKAEIKRASGEDESGVTKLYQDKLDALSGYFAGEKESTDKTFNKFKNKKVAWAAIKAVAIGGAVGAVAQEVRSVVHPGETGLIEGIRGKGAEYAVTPMEWVRRYVSGDDSIRLDGAQEALGRGTPDYQQFAGGGAEPLFVDDGNLSPEEYLKKYPDQFDGVHRTLWYDNNTPKPIFDKNELKLWWGGNKNAGLNENGDYVFDISHMKPKGSYHDQFNVDAQNAMRDGKIKLLLSMSENTQAKAVELEVGLDGEIIIPKDSETAKLFFDIDKKGHAVFKGRYAEVAEVMGEKDGVDQVRILATHEGKGVDAVPKDVVIIDDPYKGLPQEGLGKAPEGPYIYPPPIIPIQSRKEMESMGKGIVDPPEESKEKGPIVTPEIKVNPSYGYLYGETSQENKEVFKKLRSSTLDSDPAAHLDHYKESEIYLEHQDPEYLSNMENLANQVGPMSMDVKLAVCIPVAGHQEGKNIYRTLENYSHQTEPSKDFEIVLFVNRPENTEPDETIDEINKFKKDYPEMQIRVINEVLPKEKAKIGYVRKVLNDVVLYRHHQRGSDVPDLIMVSNDADNKGLAPTYVENFIHKFEEDPDTDAYLGQLDWDPESYVNNPLVHVGTRLFQYVDAQSRKKGWHIGSSGANFAFRSSIYAGVGGYLANRAGGEDTALGEAIQSARSGSGRTGIKYGGTRVSRLYTSSRRAIDSLNSGFAPIEQWDKGFSAYDDEVRKIDAGNQLDIDYENSEQVEQLISQTQTMVNRTLQRSKVWGGTSEDPVFKRAMNFLGIKFEVVNPHEIRISDASKLVADLKKYKEEAGKYRGANAEVRQNVRVPLKRENVSTSSDAKLEENQEVVQKDIDIVKLRKTYPGVDFPGPQSLGMEVSKHQEGLRNFIKATEGLNNGFPKDIKFTLGNKFKIDKAKVTLDMTKPYEKIRNDIHVGLRRANPKKWVELKPLT